MPQFGETVRIVVPWSDWLFLAQQRDVGGGGGFHIHNPWGNSNQSQGSADRNRLEIGYRTAQGADLWGQFVIHGPTGNVGIGTVAPADKLHVVGNVRANDFMVTSDARLKTDIHPIRDSMLKLMKLRGVEFTWKEIGCSSTTRATLRRGAGVVAQEVESVAPELMDPGADDGYKGVNLSGLLGTLIEAFKELAAENGALKLRIEALERPETAEPPTATAEG